MLSVLRERAAAVPHFPVVDVAPVRIIGVVKRSAGGGACRPVECLRVIFSEDFRDDPLIHEQIVSDLTRFCHPAPLVHKHFHLIVSAPQAEAGVMAEPCNIIDKFLPDIRLEFFRQLIDGAGKHEILPDNQAQFVAQIIEPVVRIEAAAPYTDRIKVCKAAVLKEPLCPFSAPPSEEVVLRYIICSHGKETDSVYLMGKALAPRILFPFYSQRAQADSFLPDIAFFFSDPHGYFHIVKRLVSQAVRPPELRVFDDQRSSAVRQNGPVCFSVRGCDRCLPADLLFRFSGISAGGTAAVPSFADT